MSEVPDNRCGYTWPQDHEIDADPNRQSCCFRETASETTDRCIWHVDPDTVSKSETELQAARTPPAIRAQNQSVAELLDGVNLAGVNLGNTCSLANVALRDADISNTDLSSADLSDANLSYATLSDAKLSEATLSSADLYSADLQGAKLSEADLRNVYFGDADLQGAYLGDADLTGSYLGESKLVNTIMPESDFSECALPEADLTGADLGGADLSNTYFGWADLSNAVLTDSRLEGADFTAATFHETILPTGEQLATADLTESDLAGQDLRDKDLSGAHLPKADLTDADLSGANLSKANLERVLLNRSDLFDTCLSGARLEGAVLGDAQINEGTFERLSPATPEKKYDNYLFSRIRRLVVGPTGHDPSRCVYDPQSNYDLSVSGKVHEENTDSSSNEDDKPAVDDPEVRAGGVYRQFERLARENAMPDWQQRFFILRQDMQTRHKTGSKYWFALLQRTMFGYGESFSRVTGWSGVIVLLFSLIYLVGGWVRPVTAGGELGPPIVWTRIPADPSILWESLYYSSLTFTALGFGDFRPANTIGQLLTVLETASGAILLALLVFVLGRKAAH